MAGSSLPQGVCATCGLPFADEDSVRLIGRALAHLDCERPATLTADERLLLATYCWNHTIADCDTCQRSYRLPELVSTPVDGETHFCPFCRRDMINSVRAHLYHCTILPVNVRQRAEATRETARLLVKRFHELADTGDVLRRQTEAAVQSLRQAMRISPWTRTLLGRAEKPMDDNQQSA